jgi:hypothetical protein
MAFNVASAGCGDALLAAGEKDLPVVACVLLNEHILS